MGTRREKLWAALTGALAALATLAVAEALAAIMVLPASSPLFAVGSIVIDLVPGWLKETVIALFGTADKIALFASLGMLVLVLAAGIGILQYRRPPWGMVALTAIGLVATLAASTRADASGIWAIPTLVGVVVGVFVLRATTDRLRDWMAAAGVAAGAAGAAAAARGVDASSDQRASREVARAALTRRRFVALLGGTAAGAIVVGLGARAINAGTAAVNTVREALTLPKPATAAPTIVSGAELGIPGLSPIISSNETFYRIDTALQIPVIDAATWKLKIFGMVDNEIEIGFDELLALPLTEHAVTLMCVSNEVGGDLIGNAIWLGYPIRELLKRAGPKPGADMVLSRSIDGFTASTPLSVLQEADRDCLLAVGMNGSPLPLEHGFPVRMVVPGLYGYVSATKWVVELEVTRFADKTAYWTDRGWSDHGPVKTSSRIDVPASGARLSAGTVPIAGVAWAQHTGITGVEVRIDSGSWMTARLADAISADTWVQWVYQWEATSGNHLIEVRATDAAGTIQSGKRVGTVPDGAEGWHSVTVAVG